MSQGALTVAAITADEHLAFIESQRSASFLQTPAWGAVKAEWRRESIGWRDASGDLVGAALVLHRPIPRLKRFTLAYLPEGPLIDWADTDLARWLDPMTAYLKEAGAFGIRMGPRVVDPPLDAPPRSRTAWPTRPCATLRDVPTELDQVGARVVRHLSSERLARPARRRGLRHRPAAVHVRDPAGRPRRGGRAPRHEPAVAPQHQEGRQVRGRRHRGGRTAADLERFHTLYVETAARDHFTPRGLRVLPTMLDAMTRRVAGADPAVPRRRHEGELVAATIYVRVGAHTWYLYGASSTAKRDVRGSNAVQWAMLRAALAAGADVYDLRGITSTLDADDSHAGLIQFKVGTGGEAVETVGEWDLPLNTPLYKAFDLYMRRRG